MAGTGAAAAATSGGGVQGRSAADGASGDGSRARSTTLQPAPNASTPTTQTPRRRGRMSPTPCRNRAQEDQRWVEPSIQRRNAEHAEDQPGANVKSSVDSGTSTQAGARRRRAPDRPRARRRRDVTNDVTTRVPEDSNRLHRGGSEIRDFSGNRWAGMGWLLLGMHLPSTRSPAGPRPRTLTNSASAVASRLADDAQRRWDGEDLTLRSGQEASPRRPATSQVLRPTPCREAGSDTMRDLSARSRNVPGPQEIVGHSWCGSDSPSSGFRTLGDSGALGDAPV